MKIIYMLLVLPLVIQSLPLSPRQHRITKRFATGFVPDVVTLLGSSLQTTPAFGVNTALTTSLNPSIISILLAPFAKLKSPPPLYPLRPIILDTRSEDIGPSSTVYGPPSTSYGTPAYEVPNIKYGTPDPTEDIDLRSQISKTNQITTNSNIGVSLPSPAAKIQPLAPLGNAAKGIISQISGPITSIAASKISSITPTLTTSNTGAQISLNTPIGGATVSKSIGGSLSPPGTLYTSVVSNRGVGNTKSVVNGPYLVLGGSKGVNAPPLILNSGHQNAYGNQDFLEHKVAKRDANLSIDSGYSKVENANVLKKTGEVDLNKEAKNGDEKTVLGFKSKRQAWEQSGAQNEAPQSFFSNLLGYLNTRPEMYTLRPIIFNIPPANKMSTVHVVQSLSDILGDNIKTVHSHTVYNTTVKNTSNSYFINSFKNGDIKNTLTTGVVNEKVFKNTSEVKTQNTVHTFTPIQKRESGILYPAKTESYVHPLGNGAAEQIFVQPGGDIIYEYAQPGVGVADIIIQKVGAASKNTENLLIDLIAKEPQNVGPQNSPIHDHETYSKLEKGSRGQNLGPKHDFEPKLSQTAPETVFENIGPQTPPIYDHFHETYTHPIENKAPRGQNVHLGPKFEDSVQPKLSEVKSDKKMEEFENIGGLQAPIYEHFGENYEVEKVTEKTKQFEIETPTMLAPKVSQKITEELFLPKVDQKGTFDGKLESDFLSDYEKSLNASSKGNLYVIPTFKAPENFQNTELQKTFFENQYTTADHKTLKKFGSEDYTDISEIPLEENYFDSNSGNFHDSFGKRLLNIRK